MYKIILSLFVFGFAFVGSVSAATSVSVDTVILNSNRSVTVSGTSAYDVVDTSTDVRADGSLVGNTTNTNWSMTTGVLGSGTHTLSAQVGSLSDSKTIFIQGLDNGDPMKVGMPWGLTGEQTPVVKAGAKITDEAGTIDTCPAFFTQGCFNIVKTNYYHESRLNVAKDLVKNYGKATAIRVFPSFAYWVNLVK